MVERGEVPATELVDGGLLLAAGSMLIVPGFVTDAVGLLLLLPPVRALFRNRLGRPLGRPVGPVGGTAFIDVEYIGDVSPRPSPADDLPPELGPGR